MKKLFKKIVRRVDEKMSKSIKEIRETIKEIKETMIEISNDSESKNTIANISLCLGSALTMYGIITKLELRK